MGKLRLSKATSLFLAWAKKNRAPGTVAGYKHYLDRFIKATKDKFVDRITIAIVETWSNKWHAMQAVQRLFQWLHLHAKKIKTNPLAGMSLPKTKKRRRILEISEMVKMFRTAKQPLRRLLVAIRETIARPGEIREATWDAIRKIGERPMDLPSLVRGECFLCVIDGKGFNRRNESDEVRMIPINDRVGRLIARLIPSDGRLEGHIFRDGKGRPWTVRSLREAMRCLRDRAKLGADWRGERVVCYTLRHTGATAAAAAGVKEYLLMGLLGHATPRMVKRYVHIQPDMIQEGMRRIIEAKTAHRDKNGRPELRRKRPDTPKG